MYSLHKIDTYVHIVHMHAVVHECSRTRTHKHRHIVYGIAHTLLCGLHNNARERVHARERLTWTRHAYTVTIRKKHNTQRTWRTIDSRRRRPPPPPPQQRIIYYENLSALAGTQTRAYTTTPCALSAASASATAFAVAAELRDTNLDTMRAIRRSQCMMCAHFIAVISPDCSFMRCVAFRSQL